MGLSVEWAEHPLRPVGLGCARERTRQGPPLAGCVAAVSAKGSPQQLWPQRGPQRPSDLKALVGPAAMGCRGGEGAQNRDGTSGPASQVRRGLEEDLNAKPAVHGGSRGLGTRLPAGKETINQRAWLAPPALYL